MWGGGGKGKFCVTSGIAGQSPRGPWMFATRTSKRSQTPAAQKPERLDRFAGEKEGQAPNPVWQSFALRPAIIQTKLAISQPGDPYEQEADRIADRVMRMATPASAS